MTDQHPAPLALWPAIDELFSRLEATQTAQPGREALLLRILKLSEEAGEVAEAVIGATGQNPARASPTPGTTSRPNCATSSSPPWSPSGP